jgi:hypothetical protein
MRSSVMCDKRREAVLPRSASWLLYCVVLAIDVFLSFPARTEPTPQSANEVTPLYASLIAEAAERFAISAAWISAVMEIESHGDARAVSPKGAIGLMQVMPKTYEGLRARYALGADPFDPRDNITAGAAYLRELYDRFGVTGFLAAYNAGPERYQDYVSARKPLPLETRAYVAQLALRLAGALPDGALTSFAHDADWQSAALFASHAKTPSADRATVFVPASSSRPTGTKPSSDNALVPPRGALFVSRSSAKSKP